MQLGGRDHTGAWKTGAAKEYPSALNEAFATVMGKAYLKRQSTAMTQSLLPPEVVAEFQQLYAGDVDVALQTMQPDFHRPGVILNTMD